MLFTGKKIVVIPTGARESMQNFEDFLNILKEEDADTFVAPTPSCLSMINHNIVSDLKFIESNQNSTVTNFIASVDIVVVAPCTFNSLSKIANGIGDNVPLMLLHTAIAQHKDVFIVPSMIDTSFYEYPFMKQSINILSKYPFKNVKVIEPENIYSSDGILEKKQMVSWNNVIDCIGERFTNVRFSGKRIKKSKKHDILKIREANDFFSDFFCIGKELQENHFVSETNGFIAKRIPEGILITSLRAKIGDLERSNLTLIRSWKKNRIVWLGNLPPSADAILATEILNRRPKIKVLIRGYFKETQTNNIAEYTTSEYVGFRNWGNLKEVLEILDNSGYCNLRSNGQIIASDSAQNALEVYKKMCRITC